MSNTRVDLASLLLRLSVGGLMFAHGYHKISAGFEEGVKGIKGMLAGSDMPEWLAYGVYVGELVAPVLLVLGLFVPLAGLAVAGTMAFAVYLAHSNELWSFTAYGGHALELQALFLVGGLACALLGAGRFAVPSPFGKKPPTLG